MPEVKAEVRIPPCSRRRMPWRDLVGLLVSCLIVVVAFSPVVFGGRTLSTAATSAGVNGFVSFPGETNALRDPTDLRVDTVAQSWQAEPWAEVAHRAYADGEPPLWNPYQGAGAPLAANMSSAVFDPLLLAVNLHPTPLTWDLSILAAFILGAAAAYLFGRVLGLRVVPAVVGNAAFSLSGWFFLHSNNQFSRSYVFLPLLFLLVELTLRSRRWWWPVLGLGIAVAENIYVGMPEASFFVIGAASVYAAVRLVQERAAMPMRVSVARLSGAVLLGLLLAAPILLLFLEYESLSVNVHKPEFGRGSEADSVWGLLKWMVPFSPGVHEAPAWSWFGVAVVVSALVALSGRQETKRLHAWLFFVLGVVVLVKSYDFHVFEWIGRLPVARLVVFPQFAAPVAGFGFAMLAGIGVQVLWNRDLRVRRFVTLLASALLVLVVVLIADDPLRAIVEERQAVWRGRAFFAVLAVTAAVMAVAAVVLASRLGRRWAAWLLAGTIVAELLVLAPVNIYAKRADPFVAPGWMAFVRIAQAPEPNSRVFGIDGKLYPNTAAGLGLQDIRTLDALNVARYRRYVQAFVQPAVRDEAREFDVVEDTRFTGSDARPTRFENNPMFDALGVRAILSERALDAPGLRFLGRDRNTRVYENIRAYPRAWVVHDVHAVGDEQEAFEFLKAHARLDNDAFIVDSFDPRHEAVVERGGKTTEDTLRGLQGDQGCLGERSSNASIQRYSSNSVSLRVDAACPGLLVLPDTYFPGWKATVNGQERTIYPTDGAFRGVTVPRGTSEVEFRYEPRAFPIGVALAAAGLVGFLVTLLVASVRTRTSRRC